MDCKSELREFKKKIDDLMSTVLQQIERIDTLTTMSSSVKKSVD